MKFLTTLSLLYILVVHTSYSQDLFDPSNTKIVIAGVLRWQDTSVATFSDKNRKDKELYETFKNMGVSESNMILLLDEQATLDGMLSAVKKMMQSSDEKTTFIFYYAGHGVKAKKNYFFCNYDMKKKDKTKFNVSYLSKLAAKNFKGKRVILMADCCYSGALIGEGNKIAGNKKETIVLTSSSFSNISTGNWTFTQIIIDNLNGLPAGDRNRDGNISLSEMATEVSDAMRYKERQLNGYSAQNTADERIIVQKTRGAGKIKELNSDFKIDQYVYALTRGNWQAGRVCEINSSDIKIEFYDYSEKRQEIIHRKFVKAIETPDYSSYKKVQVKWENKFYPATIVKSENDFYFIQYDGYDATWNEWVMYDRIKTGEEKQMMAEWNTGWYKVNMLQEKDGKYFITYIGYDHTWDEWVGKDRIKK